MNIELEAQWEQDVKDYGENAYFMYSIGHKGSTIFLHNPTSNTELNALFSSNSLAIRRKESAELPFDLERAKAGDTIEAFISYSGWVEVEKFDLPVYDEVLAPYFKHEILTVYCKVKHIKIKRKKENIMSTEFELPFNLELSESSAKASLIALVPKAKIENLLLDMEEDSETLEDQDNLIPFTLAENLTKKDLRSLIKAIDYMLDCDTIY